MSSRDVAAVIATAIADAVAVAVLPFRSHLNEINQRGRLHNISG